VRVSCTDSGWSFHSVFMVVFLYPICATLSLLVGLYTRLGNSIWFPDQREYQWFPDL
jgi:hypothetical protein